MGGLLPVGIFVRLLRLKANVFISNMNVDLINQVSLSLISLQVLLLEIMSGLEKSRIIIFIQADLQQMG